MNRQITIDDRRQPNPNITPLIERRGGEAQPFVAPWRRRQLEQAAERQRQGKSRFEAVHDLTGVVAL
jgi:hypothetical protein